MKIVYVTFINGKTVKIVVYYIEQYKTLKKLLWFF